MSLSKEQNDDILIFTKTIKYDNINNKNNIKKQIFSNYNEIQIEK